MLIFYKVMFICMCLSSLLLFIAWFIMWRKCLKTIKKLELVQADFDMEKRITADLRSQLWDYKYKERCEESAEVAKYKKLYIKVVKDNVDMAKDIESLTQIIIDMRKREQNDGKTN